ncbi:MAG: AAA family ATPase [Kofleriaceae bacterium]|nr:AAA family ATPase [Kofleriaceae bacterium]MBP6840118.1 AAA family ATPase [Kofleriaceae bacterium]MBP9203621.1 AAA family ATPase [Kofleriaceae bacterium]
MSLVLADDLIVHPMVPRGGGWRLPADAAHRLLERHRVIAMALAVRAIAWQWDRGLIASRATTQLAPGEEPLPYEQEVLGLIGVTRGQATAHLAEAEAGVTQAVADLAAFEAELGEVTLPTRELSAEFELTVMTQLMLMLIAAPQLWGEVRELYGVARNDRTRPGVDEYLVQALLGPQVDPHLVAEALEPAAGLRSSGLVQQTDPGADRPVRPLTVEPLVLARLRGDDLGEDPAARLLVRTGAPPLATLVVTEGAAAAVHAWAADRRARPPALVLRGGRASGRTTLAAALAQRAGRHLAVIDLATLPASDADLLDLLGAELRRCRVAGWVPCVTGLGVVAPAEREQARLRHVLAAHAGPLVVRLDREQAAPLEPGYHLVELRPLDEGQRATLWQRELGDLPVPAGTAASLASRWRVGPGVVCAVARAAATAALEGGAATADGLVGQLEAAITQHLQGRLGDVAERITTLPRLADMVLPADVEDSVTEFLARQRLGRQVYEEWGLSRIATTGRGLTALFAGGPGTGKTMLAGAIAHELGLDLYRVDLSRIMSKWIGETERNLAAVFAAAEDGHAIVLFDEADSLFAKRTEVKSAGDRHANVEVNYLLQRLDTFTGICILTTNFGTAIDPAFKRRLAFRVTFPIPDEELRELLWRRHLPPGVPVADDLDLAELARRFHLSGGAVRNCALRAAFLAAADGRVISQAHLLRAIRIEYRAVGKLAEGGPLE